MTKSRWAPRNAVLLGALLAATMGCNTCGDLAARHPFDTVDTDVGLADSSGSDASDDRDTFHDTEASGIWVDPEVVRALPTNGPAWDAVVSAADELPGTPNISDQDSSHDVETLAGALVCVRLAEADRCESAKLALLDAIGTEDGARWFAIGRNLTSYVIAADLLGLRADGDADSDGTRVQEWLAGFLSREFEHQTSGELVPISPWGSANRAQVKEGEVFTAIAAYLNDPAALARAWDAFRTYACDPGAPDHENIEVERGVESGWAHDDTDACAINPKGSRKVVPPGLPGAGTERNIDGALIGDMYHDGGDFQWPPLVTNSPWGGLEGALPAALLLHRAGYPAFEVADQAMRRAIAYLWFLREDTGDVEWFDGERASEAVHIGNIAYGEAWPSRTPIGEGRTVGFTDWTHPNPL